MRYDRKISLKLTYQSLSTLKSTQLDHQRMMHPSRNMSLVVLHKSNSFEPWKTEQFSQPNPYLKRDLYVIQYNYFGYDKMVDSTHFETQPLPEKRRNSNIIFNYFQYVRRVFRLGRDEMTNSSGHQAYLAEMVGAARLRPISNPEHEV